MTKMTQEEWDAQFGSKPLTKKQQKRWLRYTTVCSLIGAAIAYYLITNPEVVHPPKPMEYTEMTSIPDQNGDRIPELSRKNEDGTIDTLLSHVEGNEVVYRK